MSLRSNTVALLFIALGLAAPSHAAWIALGSSPTVPPTDNASLDMAVPGGSVTLYVWAKRTGDSGFVNALGLNIKAVPSGTNTQVPLSALSFVWDNPTTTLTDPDSGDTSTLSRWDSVVAPTYNAVVGGSPMAVFDARAFTIASSPAATFSPVRGTFVRVATLSFTMSSPRVDLFVGVSPFWISESGGTATSFFGFGDAAIPSTGAAASNTFSVRSETIYPEPTAAGLAGAAAGVGLLRRGARHRRV